MIKRSKCPRLSAEDPDPESRPHAQSGGLPAVLAAASMTFPRKRFVNGFTRVGPLAVRRWLILDESANGLNLAGVLWLLPGNQ